MSVVLPAPISPVITQRVVKVPHVAMVNLVAERRVVPELIQDAFTAKAVTAALLPLLEDGPERAGMMQELKEVAGKLRRDENSDGGAMERVAAVVAETLGLQPETGA